MFKITVTAASLLLVGLVVSAYAGSPPASVQAVMSPYLKIHDALAKDSMIGVSDDAKAIAEAAKKDASLPKELASEAQDMANASDLKAARTAFIPLSKTLIGLVKDGHLDGYVQAHCPMVNADWLQTGTTVSNPFGSDMAQCGTIVTANGSINDMQDCMSGGGCCH